MFVDAPDRWQAVVAERGGPVPQDWAWGQAKVDQGRRLWRWVDESGFAVQAVGADWHGIPVAWAAGGPMLRDGVSPPALGRRLRALARRLRRPLVLAPHGWDAPRPAGCLTLPSGSYLPATVVADIEGGRAAILARLHRSWRNHYRTGAQRCERLVLGAGQADVERVAALFRAGSGDRSPDVDAVTLGRLAQAFGPQLELSLAADPEGALGDFAAAVVLRGSAQALLLALVTVPAGRGRNGANLLVLEAMVAASEAGVARFDLGGIASEGDGIAHFKLRTNGTLVRNGAPFVALPVPW